MDREKIDEILKSLNYIDKLMHEDIVDEDKVEIELFNTINDVLKSVEKGSYSSIDEFEQNFDIDIFFKEIISSVELELTIENERYFYDNLNSSLIEYISSKNEKIERITNDNIIGIMNSIKEEDKIDAFFEIRRKIRRNWS